MKKSVGRENRIKTIREHLTKIREQAHENETNASMNREYIIAHIHSKYVAAIEQSLDICDAFLLFKEEKKETGG